jgi:hypothetical protein
MIQSGTEVEHHDFGVGTVTQILGNTAQVDFFGEKIDVSISELQTRATFNPGVLTSEDSYDQESIAFRQAIEAMNLGVVPPDPLQLIGLTIGGVEVEREVKQWLIRAPNDGLCKVFFGYYGSRKSHHLQLVKAIALRRGWVTAYLEFDPKAADPAKPHLVYSGLMNGLTFPEKENGERTQGFFGLIKEARNHWSKVRDGQYLKSSPWFKSALETLMYFPHQEDQDYLSAVGWLAGQVKALPIIRGLARRSGRRGELIPRLPQTKETAEIYVHHLVVINEICRNLGYKGLAIIVDEAEHVRGFNVRRRERANNFFDLLSRSAHKRLYDEEYPIRNEHGFVLPRYWEEGPHFALFVGLTEGDTFSDSSIPLREACVFLHDESDRVRLSPPSVEQYKSWCESFLAASYRHLGHRVQCLADIDSRRLIADVLSSAFDEVDPTERVLRLWIKLANLAPSVLLSHKASSVDELAEVLSKSASKASGYNLPWDD